MFFSIERCYHSQLIVKPLTSGVQELTIVGCGRVGEIADLHADIVAIHRPTSGWGDVVEG